MRLWILQHASVWDELKSEGIWRVPEIDEIYRRPYDWLVSQMESRIGKRPEGVAYPIWAWAKLQGRPDGKPDMRSVGRIWERPCVRLELEIDESRIVLSDEDWWHYVLNGSYLPQGEGDEPDLENLALQEREASWHRIFDVSGDASAKWPWIKKSIQATFWELRREDVISVEHFTKG